MWLTNLGKGWIQYLETFESFIPVQVAAAVLTKFYVSAFYHVLSIEAGRAPEKHYRCELDNLRLEFFSADTAVPWDFILSFMRFMVDGVSRGFTGKFEYLFLHMATGRAVSVSLQVVNVAAAA